jgi:type VI secretion system lysozyme-like protein
MAELVRGASGPLFDRLAAGSLHESADGTFLTAAQLQASIAYELARLLNTRSARQMGEFSTCTGTTIEYGVPDIGFLSPQSRSDLDTLETAIKQAVEFFEPRLRQVRIKAEMNERPGGGPNVVIEGMVSVGLKLRPMNFELQLEAGQAGLAKGSR